jgi:hypothetical protein
VSWEALPVSEGWNDGRESVSGTGDAAPVDANKAGNNVTGTNNNPLSAISPANVFHGGANPGPP